MALILSIFTKEKKDKENKQLGYNVVFSGDTDITFVTLENYKLLSADELNLIVQSFPVFEILSDDGASANPIS